MQTESKWQYWIYGIVCILALLAFLRWTSVLDNRRQEAYTSYEECVKEQYGGRTVGQIYMETGDYPECDNTQ